MCLLKVENLTKTIGKKTIVEDINLTVNEGEVVGFLGPNGAGKTTTIKMIMGIIKKTKGSITIAGYDNVVDHNESMTLTSAIVENPVLYKNLTGLQNLEYFAGMYEDIGDSNIESVLELVKMQDRKNDKVRTYSLGMRQRLGLAVALINNPKLLILDEPTNGLDPIGISELKALLKTLASEHGVGILISSHQLAEIEEICDKICIIDNGMTVLERSIKNIDYNTEKNKYEIISSDSEIVAEILDEFDIEFTIHKNIIGMIRPCDIDEIIKKIQNKKVKIIAVNLIIKTLEEEFISITSGSKKQIR